MRTLLPTLKEKKRYIVYQLVDDIVMVDKSRRKDTTKKEMKNIVKSITKNINDVLGMFESARGGIQHIDWNEKNNIGIIKTSNKSLIKTKIALMMIKEINNIPCFIRILGVSGILKKTARFIENI